MVEFKDRTKEVDAAKTEISINSTDYCEYFERARSTLFTNKECWYCVYSVFCKKTDASEEGTCKYIYKI